MSKTLVLFDFDGTLAKRDTFPQFIFFSQGYFGGLLGFIIFFPLIVLYILKMLSGSELKEKLVSYYFKGKSEEELKVQGERFIRKLLQTKSMNDSLIQKLKSYKSSGHVVCIVSASLNIWIEPFCKIFELDCLCTELNFENKVYTGKFKTPNCNNAEKAVRIKQKYNLKDFSKIVAYGNSNSDKAMFELATESILIRN